MMYAQEVPIINAAMRQDYPTFVRGIMFALLSARVQFPRVPAQCEELEAKGKEAKCLWGWKYDAYCYLLEHGPTLYHGVCNVKRFEPAKAISLLTRIPGMGIVKAAFVCQMLGFNVACLDTRNIQREGRDPRAYRSDGEKGKATRSFRDKIDRYVIDTHGRAEELWDTWCAEVAKDYGDTAEGISRAHMTAIVPQALCYQIKRTLAPAVDNEIPF